MPVAAERNLKKQAMKKLGSTTSPRARRYIYGAPIMKKNRKKKGKKGR